MEEKKINMIEPVEKANDEKLVRENKVYIECKTCHCLFPLTETKLDYFKNKYKTIPTHCYNCRQKRITQNEQNG